MTTVSVIMPVYNAEQTLGRCLNAITNQTFNDFEVICVNDGSNDNSHNILEDFVQKDQRIKVYYQEKKGVAYARNYALSKSCGKYIMFCDADDWYEPNMIEEMVKTIKEQNVDVVMCDADVIDLANGTIQSENYIEYNRLKNIGNHTITPKFTTNTNVVLWNKIFKKDLIDKYNITYPMQFEHDDMTFVYKYFAVAKTYFGLNKKLYHYYIGNKDSIMGKYLTNRSKGKEFDFIYAFEELFRFLQKNPNKEYQKAIEKQIIDVFNSFCKYLDVPQQYEAYRILRNFVINSGYFICKTKKIYFIKKHKNYDDYKKHILNDRVSFLQKIFSVRNENGHKVIRIAGLKISFEYKKPINTKIFIVYHKPSFLFKNDIGTPIHAGRQIMLENRNGNYTEEDIQWMNENTIGDNTGDNISNLNEYLNEETAIYWVWKNYEKIGNPTIVGFMHYRTLFMLHTYPQYESNYLDSCGFEQGLVNYLLRRRKAITGNWMIQKNTTNYNAYKSIEGEHNILFYDRLFEVLKTKYPKDYNDFYKWSMNTFKGGPYKNMFIMRKKEFFKYCNWIFPILFDLVREFENYKYTNNNEKRNMSWLAELLTAFYFDKYVGKRNCLQKVVIRPMAENN